MDTNVTNQFEAFLKSIRQNYGFIYDSIIIFDAIIMLKTMVCFILETINSKKKQNTIPKKG